MTPAEREQMLNELLEIARGVHPDLFDRAYSDATEKPFLVVEEEIAGVRRKLTFSRLGPHIALAEEDEVAEGCFAPMFVAWIDPAAFRVWAGRWGHEAPPISRRTG